MLLLMMRLKIYGKTLHASILARSFDIGLDGMQDMVRGSLGNIWG